MRSFPIYLLLAWFASCSSSDQASVQTAVHLRYFGFTLIDTYFDDPTDSQAKTNYADEVHSFNNLADMLVLEPSDSIAQRIAHFGQKDLKAVLHLNEIFFEHVNAHAPSGANYDLRPDYRERWNQFVQINHAVLNADGIGAFYIGEEPTWNGISYDELTAVTNFLKEGHSNIPILIIEAHPALPDLRVPEKVDWVGFDHDFIKNPNSDAAFQQEWEVLKTKLSGNQKIMIVMDAHYMEGAHGTYGNIAIDEMAEVAENYYQLAKNEKRVVGYLAYFWPNGFGVPGSIGGRGMPTAVKEKYIEIGKAISGKL